ncbi:hypothetical protein O9G_005799 [Rozella allomycis CSF55]|uniref:Uncharacterized protein n=1 Tax=Rozella allomycis (strain CSF55) TaxID=988480 RepID=A0A075B445_ROZAC|nr:hypothetical protein O9G_005799 [Rozella allomycis CSF55]|eukprot:EPZ36010.1 hypothetical protein O9G_005799 [Rozella allomycis CSF55]
MVTHDVYLKNFAHRVVYMRDGKISKDELIPTEVRKLAFSDLGERIEKQKRLVDTSISKHGNMYPSVDDDKKKDYVTEVRDPTDYKTFRPRPIREPAIINKLD